MKILDTLGKTKKAIGGIVAIAIVCALIFFAGMHFGGKMCIRDSFFAHLNMNLMIKQVVKIKRY